MRNIQSGSKRKNKSYGMEVLKMPKSKGAAVGGLMCLLALAAAAQENQSANPSQTAPNQQTSTAQPQAAASQPQASPAASAPAAKPEKAAEAKKSKLWGTIQSVDVAGKKITVKAKTRKGEIKEIALGETSKLTKGGNNKEISPADLKEGERLSRS